MDLGGIEGIIWEILVATIENYPKSPYGKQWARQYWAHLILSDRISPCLPISWLGRVSVLLGHMYLLLVKLSNI